MNDILSLSIPSVVAILTIAGFYFNTRSALKSNEREIIRVKERSDEKDAEQSKKLKALEDELKLKASDAFAQDIQKEMRRFAIELSRKIENLQNMIMENLKSK